MIRAVYAALLRVHPRAFRNRFGDEMLCIFDEIPVNSELYFFMTHSARSSFNGCFVPICGSSSQRS
jgi:hypothetical protein